MSKGSSAKTAMLKQFIEDFIEGRTDNISQFQNAINQNLSDHKYNFDTSIKAILAETLSEKYNDPALFSQTVACLILLNRDDFLESILNKNRNLINQIDDHRYILICAVLNSATYTFRTLLEHGFDPMKGQNINPIAIAAYNQGEKKLKDYCDAIAQKFGEPTVTKLINEKDDDGNDALSTAISGRSYARTIEFLISRGANSQNNFEKNLQNAIAGHHNQTFSILFNENKKGLSQTLSAEFFLELSDVATKNRNNGGQIFLLNALKQIPRINNSNAQEIINRKILNSESLVSDVYEICHSGTKADFDILVSNTAKSDLKKSLNGFNSDGKSPLFYALSGNCYTSLVVALLDAGANPIRLERNESGTDAASFCIRNKQSDTLGSILSHKSFQNNVDTDLIQRIALEIRQESNLNALTIREFFANIPTKTLQLLQSVNESLFGFTIDTGLRYAPQETSAKIKECFDGKKQEMLKFLDTRKEKNIPTDNNLIQNMNKYFPEMNSERNNNRAATENDPLLSKSEEKNTPNSSICVQFLESISNCFRTR